MTKKTATPAATTPKTKKATARTKKNRESSVRLSYVANHKYKNMATTERTQRTDILSSAIRNLALHLIQNQDPDAFRGQNRPWLRDAIA
jgi:hypothetical protein